MHKEKTVAQLKDDLDIAVEMRSIAPVNMDGEWNEIAGNIERELRCRMKEEYLTSK